MVIEVETLSRGIPSNSASMSSIESIATPTLPTSPAARVGKFSGKTDGCFRIAAREIFLRVDGFERNPAESGEPPLALGRRCRLAGGGIHRTRLESRNDSTPKKIMSSA